MLNRQLTNSPTRQSKPAHFLERHLERQLHLPRRSCLRELSIRRHRAGRVSPDAEDVVDLRVVGPVEQVEDLEDAFDLRSAADRELDARRARRPSPRRASCPGSRSTLDACVVGSRRARSGRECAAVAVAVQVGAGQDVVRPARRDRDDRGHAASPTARHIDAAQHEAMTLVLQRRTALVRRAEAERQTGRIGVGCAPGRCSAARTRSGSPWTCPRPSTACSWPGTDSAR